MKTPNVTYLIIAAMVMLSTINCSTNSSTHHIPIEVKDHQVDMPQLLGLPIPEGTLYSPDHVRVLDASGQEIPSQITKVSTWAPADESIKWIWVFFFSTEDDNYTVEYGDEVRNGRLYDQVLTVNNNQRPTGEVEVNTGPLRFTIEKGLGGGYMNAPPSSGFMDKVELDLEGDGFDDDDLIATGAPGRASFLDILDDAGLDPSRAVVTRTVKELGTGPLHAIIRVEGEYHYTRSDNNSSPFVMRIHAYAGKSYVRVQHTFVYTGEPDKHKKQSGEYEAIATQMDEIIDPAPLNNDPGFMQPNDRIAALGVTLDYQLGENPQVYTASYDGTWYAPGSTQFHQANLNGSKAYSMLQTGPNPSQIPPLANSDADNRMEDVFEASWGVEGEAKQQAERAPGWITVADQKRGITVAFDQFFEEYPKELFVDDAAKALHVYAWSPNVEPLSFAKKDNNNDSGMIANFAQGLAKTTDMIFYFHGMEDQGGAEANADPVAEEPEYGVDQVAEHITKLIQPPVTHANPQWYADSEAFGKMASSSAKFSDYERHLDYKFEWMRFNQQWEPWYGMLNYGDFLTYYYRNEWQMWTNNEPANDYMWWLQFIRTGNPDYYRVAKASSKHTMDVDNVHWPKGPSYFGDTNESLHALQAAAQPEGSPYLGMGRRHAEQHYTSLLSAHVWVAGWVASYYLDGNHRGLEVAKETGNYYVKRVFGDHGLKGRRLYLSVWNLAEIVDATKDPVYEAELMDRVERMIQLQYHPDQGHSIVINRYGYSQVYVSNGMRKVIQMTGDDRYKQSIIDHAIRVRDVPPYNHDMESYLSSISSLVIGYEYSGEQSLLEEAVKRAEALKTDALEKDLWEFDSQRVLSEALEQASHLPKREGGFRPAIWQMSNGLRIFGWTSIYNIPYLEYWLDD
jgi:hypothetical protein